MTEAELTIKWLKQLISDYENSRPTRTPNALELIILRIGVRDLEAMVNERMDDGK